MPTPQDRPNVPSEFTRLTAGILFVMVVGIGYVVSPRVESTADSPVQTEELDRVEAPGVAPDCAAKGLAPASCNLDG